MERMKIKIKEGRLVFKSETHENMYQIWLSQYNDKEVFFEIKENKSTRSEQQNKYYWVFLNLISDTTGFTPNEIHEWAKGKFLTEEIKNIFGSATRIKNSTKRLSKGEFIGYLQEISLETEVQLPDTTEYLGYSYNK